MRTFHFCFALLQVMKNRFCMSTENKKDNSYRKMKNQYQHQSQDTIQSCCCCFVSSGLWKVPSITSYWNMEGPLLKIFIVSNLMGLMMHLVKRSGIIPQHDNKKAHNTTKLAQDKKWDHEDGRFCHIFP